MAIDCRCVRFSVTNTEFKVTFVTVLSRLDLFLHWYYIVPTELCTPMRQLLDGSTGIDPLRGLEPQTKMSL